MEGSSYKRLEGRLEGSSYKRLDIAIRQANNKVIITIKDSGGGYYYH